jgi:SAM-dependent methyltransferase
VTMPRDRAGNGPCPEGTIVASRRSVSARSSDRRKGAEIVPTLDEIEPTELRPLSPQTVRKIRRTRRHPRWTQFDYLHLRYLIADLESALRGISPPPQDVLDVYCGSRPYEDFLPPTAHCVGLDVEGNPYGVADVVSDEFLPFPDESFDLVMCIQAFQFIPDPAQGVGEIRRVLRPGGTLVITVTHVWEYDRTVLEHRFSGPGLAHLLRGWDDVDVVENGGRMVTWVSVTTSLLRSIQNRIPPMQVTSRLARLPFAAAYLALNGFGVPLAELERRHARGPLTLPTNLLATARKPPLG